MIQQVSDFELEPMKTIWGNGGSALYAEIVQILEVKGTLATPNTIILVDGGSWFVDTKGKNLSELCQIHQCRTYGSNRHEAMGAIRKTG